MSETALEGYGDGVWKPAVDQAEVLIARDKLIMDLTEWFNQVSDMDDLPLSWRDYQVMVDIVNEAFVAVLPTPPSTVVPGVGK